MQGGGGGGGGLPVSFPFLLSPRYSRDQNLRSHATHGTSLARERLLRMLNGTSLHAASFAPIYLRFAFICWLGQRIVTNKY